MTTTEFRKAIDHVHNAIADEFVAATTKFAAFNSNHEGWAVLLEECYEMNEEVDQIESRMAGMWQAVRADDRGCARDAADGIAELAARAAVEAIQVATMARRFLADLPAEES